MLSVSLNQAAVAGRNSSHAITAYPTTNAMSVARIVGPHETEVSDPMSSASNSPDATTAGIDSRNEYRVAAWRAEGRTELRPPRLPDPDRPSWWRPTGSYDVRGNIPMGEPSTPTDIGHCIAWLSSDYARLITGCDFVVDGGARAKYWAYTPAAAAAAGPVPLIPLDVTPEDGLG